MGWSPVNAVFDTNILIDALNGIDKANEEYARYEKVFISRIAWMEVLIGAPEDDAQVRNFLANYFEILPLNLAIAEKAIQLRRQYKMRLPDAIIWATAKINDAVLVSRNTKDFNPEWDGVRLPYTV